MHDFPLITTIAAAFAVAWLLGMLTHKLGLSPIVGYLLAGVIIGPHSPGFVAEVALAGQLAEIGVILLMFGVGLHFHFKDLLAVRSIAVPGAIIHSLIAIVLGFWVFTALGERWDRSFVLAIAISVASTVVLMRVLEDANSLDTPQGHIAVGLLLVEDILTVIVLVLLPVVAVGDGGGGGSIVGLHLWKALGIALLKIGALVAIVLFAGSRAIPWVLVQVARLRSRELFTLTVLVVSISIAAGSYVFFGASMALGAFLAGMVVAQSPVSEQAAADALPMRDAFAVLFFVSVGMLFDPAFILKEPMMILAALGIILIVKPLSALLIVAVLGHSVTTALTVAIGLGQIGEFSFILSQLGHKYGVMSEAGHNALVAGAIISITLNPLLFRYLGPIESWLRARPRLWKLLNARAERRVNSTNLAASDHVRQRLSAGERLAVIVGYGPVGRSLNRIIRGAGLTTTVIDMNMDTVTELNREQQPAIFGDASRQNILEQAGVGRASHMIVTLPHSSVKTAIITAGRSLNPNLRVFVRSHYLREREDLEQAGATGAVFEEAEAAIGLARLVLADTGARREVAERKLRDLRLQLIMENISNIGAQHVRSVMVSWTRVRRLSTTATREQVLKQIAEERFSRWPVIDPKTGKTNGYLLTKDLIAEASAAEDWTRLVRPLRAVSPNDDIESTLTQMQAENASLRVVQEGGLPVGLITIEDILEQVVGRLDDEYPREAKLSLRETIAAGGVVLNLAGRTKEEVIAELAAAISPDKRPPGVNIRELALAREAELSTDLGIGVAIPHARAAGIREPLVVFGRSADGIIFSPHSPELVHIVFLLVTSLDQPEVQLFLLGQIAALAADESARERLRHASSASEVMDLLTEKGAEPGGLG